jgi:hypothetical protein
MVGTQDKRGEDFFLNIFSTFAQQLALTGMNSSCGAFKTPSIDWVLRVIGC